MNTKEVTEISLPQLDLWSFISSIASLILAVVAIALSILFYVMSKKSSEAIESSSNSIKTNVDRLDQLFNKMYTDTFSIVKDTVQDMRKGYYVNNSNKEASDELERKTKDIVEKIVENNINYNHLEKQDIEELMYQAIDKSKQLQRKLELNKFKTNLYKMIKNNGGSIPFQVLSSLYEDDFGRLWTSLEELAKENKIEDPFKTDPDYDGEGDGPKIIFSATDIKLKDN